LFFCRFAACSTNSCTGQFKVALILLKNRKNMPLQILCEQSVSCTKKVETKPKIITQKQQATYESSGGYIHDKGY